MTEGADGAALCRRRVANSAALGVLYSGVLYPAYYRALERHLPQQTRRNLLIKICSDLVCFGVVCNTANIYHQPLHKLAHIVEVFAAEMAVWPAAAGACPLVVWAAAALRELQGRRPTRVSARRRMAAVRRGSALSAIRRVMSTVRRRSSLIQRDGAQLPEGCPKMVGEYTITSVLRQGGTAEVY
eukprot:gene38271-51228_t